MLQNLSKPHLSTNEKINRILNGPDDDDEDEDIKLAKKVQIKKHIQRANLYGVGFRATLPKVKNNSKKKSSSLLLNPNTDDQPTEIYEKSTVPPGAHDDQYRMVQNNTTYGSNPDRIFYTTTSVTDGIRIASQPPWYIGHQNRVYPPDSSIIMSTARYGFRGSKGIRKYEIEPYMSPIRTRNEHTPKFLQKEPVIDEWVPKLTGSALNHGYQLTTPKLWPENAEYVTGYPNKALPSSTIYKKETTVGTDIRPATTKSMKQIENMFKKEESELLENSQLEATRSVLSRPMTEQNTFRSKWHEHLSKSLPPKSSLLLSGSSTDQMMRFTNNTSHPSPSETNRARIKTALLDVSDTIRYSQSGGTSLLVHSQSSDVLKYKNRIEQSQTLIPYRLRWTQIYMMVNAIKSKLKRDQTLNDVTNEMAMRLHVDTSMNLKVSPANLDVITRSNFNRTLRSIEQLNSIPANQINLLYTSFDYLQLNGFPLVDVISSFLILDMTSPSTRTSSPSDNSPPMVTKKLSSLWHLYESFSHSLSPLETCKAILLSCVSSDDERQTMESLFKQQFRPKCYSVAVLREPVVASPLRQKSADSSKFHSSTSSNSNNNNDAAGISQFPYSICDSCLDLSMFLDVLEDLPEVVREFDYQLTSRLVECYGITTA